jgi:hypothetical protein
VIAAILFLQEPGMAEIYAGVEDVSVDGKSATQVPPLSTNVKVWMKCRWCESYEQEVGALLRGKGYTLVERTSDADVRVIVAGRIGIPRGDSTPEEMIDEVFGQPHGPLPPAIPDDNAKISSTNPSKGPFDMDAGHIRSGAQLTGSAGGGIAVGIFGAIVSRFVQQRAADKERTPGVALVGVRVVGRTTYSFTMAGAADTRETPEAILRKTTEKAIQVLAEGGQVVTGVKELRGGVKEAGAGPVRTGSVPTPAAPQAAGAAQ